MGFNIPATPLNSGTEDFFEFNRINPQSYLEEFRSYQTTNASSSGHGMQPIPLRTNNLFVPFIRKSCIRKDMSY
jgi:hypothetical protein